MSKRNFLVVLLVGLLISCNSNGNKLNDYDQNERDLAVKILSGPIWNYDYKLAGEYFDLLFKNSNIKSIDIILESGSVVFTKDNPKYESDTKQSIIDSKKYTLISNNVEWESKIIGKIVFKY